MENIVDFIEKFKKKYPDLMVLSNMNDFERFKLIGKVELLNEMTASLKDKDED